MSLLHFSTWTTLGSSIRGFHILLDGWLCVPPVVYVYRGCACYACKQCILEYHRSYYTLGSTSCQASIIPTYNIKHFLPRVGWNRMPIGLIRNLTLKHFFLVDFHVWSIFPVREDICHISAADIGAVSWIHNICHISFALAVQPPKLLTWATYCGIPSNTQHAYNTYGT